MRSFAKKFLFIYLSLFVGHISFAQECASFRTFLSKVHISTSVGYGRTHYQYCVFHTAAGQEAAGEVVVSKQKGQFYLHTKDSHKRLIAWFGGQAIAADQEDIGLKEVSTIMQFAGRGTTLPVSLVAHIDLFEQARVGVGGLFIFNRLEELKPEEKHLYLGSYFPSQKTHYYLRPFFLFGLKVVSNSTVSVLLDTNFGYDYMYSFEKGFVNLLNLGVKNIGVTVEGNISEYFRLFGKVSCERSDSEQLVSNDQTGRISAHKSILVQFGLSFNFPEYSRCQLAGCKIERRHKHGGKVYRGVSIFTSSDAQGRRIYQK